MMSARSAYAISPPRRGARSIGTSLRVAPGLLQLARRRKLEQLRGETRHGVVELEGVALLGLHHPVVHELLREPQHDDAEAVARVDLVVVRVLHAVAGALA